VQLLPAEFSFRTLGPHRIPDLPRSIELFQLHGPGLRRTFPPLRTRGNSASTIMAVAIVDEVGSLERLDATDNDILEWQRTLIRTIRELSERHDGRHLKLVGDGCMASFEDPRSALGFARDATDNLPVRSGVAVGVVDVVEGEVTGRVVFDAYRLMRSAASGEIRICPLMTAMCGGDHQPPH
jgi:class 3 adenylate cyclase